MALIAPVKDGKIEETTSQSSLSNKVKGPKNDMDKDAFLQLLVAQMKYQDPMEPTSNTEYISQYAQFSQVEQMQNMSANSDLARASALVGKDVYVKTTTSSGDTKYVQGKVDYVVFENGKAYLSIDESLYSLDDLDTVADKEYLNAYDKATDFNVRLNKLPVLAGISMDNASEIDELQKIYQEMNDYEKGFIASDAKTRFDAYVKKLEELRETQDEA